MRYPGTGLVLFTAVSQSNHSRLSFFRTAAQTALDVGVSADDFARHYAPLVRAIHRDNGFGTAIFAAHRRIKESAALFRTQSRLLASEQSRGRPEQLFSRALWGIFTESYPYRKIVGMAHGPDQ